MRELFLFFSLGLFLAHPAAAQLTPDQKLAREIFKELVEINTTDSVGDNTAAANAMAKRLLAAGFPSADVQVLNTEPRKGNLVARLRGSGAKKPILLLAHLDVVEARREDWSVDPFTFLERDGFFYGRGTADDKAQAAIWIANLIRFKQEGFVPDRDLIVALTADEEGGNHNGVSWLLEHHRNLVDSAFALNEGGGGQLKAGKKLLNELQASEKVYQSFRLEVRDSGGHSSLPRPENPIYRMSEALARLSRFAFPVTLNDVTRAFFDRMSKLESGQLAADMRAVLAPQPDLSAVSRLSSSPYYNALLRTTCVATQLSAGHAENALPQLATAVVNCRMLPGSKPEDVQATLTGVIADSRVSIAPVAESRPSDPSPLTTEVLGAVERVTEELWPGVPVVPTMATGATDGLFLRNAGIPTYGVSGLFEDIDDTRSHGRDERMGVKEFYDGQEFLYRLVKTLSSSAKATANR
jgi:acetylornithine deacetylase/succinyl-diaminopimelate desuccinylase-like protein